MTTPKPTDNGTRPRSPMAVRAAYALVAVSCVAGLVFCLLKSPQSRAQAYIGAAFSAMQDNLPHQAVGAALTAVRLDPMSAKGWQVLSETLARTGDVAGAAQARNIAARVQQTPEAALPVYAMPADFKLGPLALAQPQDPQ